MGSVYSLRIRTTVTTTAAVAAEFYASSTRRLYIFEMGIFLGAATASNYAIGRPAAQGVTPTAPIAGLVEEPIDAAGTGKMAVAWNTDPTMPVSFFRAISLPGITGTGVIWTWEKGQELIVPATGVASIVLWNQTTNSAATDWYVKWRE